MGEYSEIAEIAEDAEAWGRVGRVGGGGNGFAASMGLTANSFYFGISCPKGNNLETMQLFYTLSGVD